MRMVAFLAMLQRRPPGSWNLRRALFWRLCVALMLPVPIWTGYLSYAIHRAQRQIVRDLPLQVQRPLQPRLRATQPPLVFLSPPTSPSVPMPTPVQTTPVPVQLPSLTWQGKQRITTLVLIVDKPAKTAAIVSGILLASVDFERSTVTIVPVPSNLFVELPDVGYHTLHMAYQLGEGPQAATLGGGLGLMINTLRLNFGLEQIDEFLVVELGGVVQAVDVLGGVDIDVPQPFADSERVGVKFEPGLQHMDGARALQYVRLGSTRDVAADGRGRQVLLSLQHQLNAFSLVRLIPSLLRVVGDSVQTSLTLDEQIRIGQWLKALLRENVAVVPINAPLAKTEAGERVMYADWTTLNPVLQHVFGPQAGHR